MNGNTARVGIIMGSVSDWDTMAGASETLESLGVAHETRVVSAHRTPDLLFDYCASARERGIEVIIAGAGGAAHLPGMAAAKTSVPVLGVPVQSRALNGLDSLLSIVQMPAGIPVGTLAIGRAGAVNAALLAAAILANHDEALRAALDDWRRRQTERVLERPDPSVAD
jgi:5-(carboxyamino)imidazole ribonucleotide mutase